MKRESYFLQCLKVVFVLFRFFLAVRILFRVYKSLVSSSFYMIIKTHRNFPGGPVVKTSHSNTGGEGLIPGRGAKIPYASRPKTQNIKQKQYCNKFNKDIKNGPHQKKYMGDV